MVAVGKKLDVVVTGGSLSGLMVGTVLTRLGHNVSILERSPTPLLHNQGAGVVAGGETQAFFRRHDRTKRPLAVTSAQRLYLNQDGDVIDREDSVQRMTSWDLLYYLGRANFDRVKSDYLPPGVDLKGGDSEGTAAYEYGCTVTGVKELGEKVQISYQDKRSSSGKEKEVTIEADFLIAADGPSSSLRPLLCPGAPSRTYAGYVAFRGTVSETELSQSATDVFVEKFTFFHGPETQILAYTIPGPAGALDRGKRLVNWVWYCNYEQSSKEYEELMTDSEGVKHRFTLPTGGKMRPEMWKQQMETARAKLPRQFSEIVTKTSMPFVQAITDLSPPKRGTKISRLLNGKAILVGDALSGFRPHTAASTSQAAFHALMLEAVFEEKLSWDEYDEQVLEFAEGWFRRGVSLGNRSQFGKHPLQSAS